MPAIRTMEIADRYRAYLQNKQFPCVAAKAAVSKGQIDTFIAGHMACPKDDLDILNFLYSFVDKYRASGTPYHSAAVIFDQSEQLTEKMFEIFLWQRLQALADLDARQFNHDKRVSADPLSPDFSFSIREEAFFIIGLHPDSSRQARRFDLPTLVFNPHAEFEKLRASNKYESMKTAVRKRDLEFSGSVNPMLRDFGHESEVFQYSGNQYDQSWKCPLMINRKH